MLTPEEWWGIGARTIRYLEQSSEFMHAKGVKSFIADQLGNERESLEVLCFAASELIARSQNKASSASKKLLIRQIDSQLEQRYSEQMVANGKEFARGFLGIEKVASNDNPIRREPEGGKADALRITGTSRRTSFVAIAVTSAVLIALANLFQYFLYQRESRSSQGGRAAPIAGFKLMSESKCEGIEASLYAALENSVKTEDPMFPWGYPASVIIGEKEYKGTLKTSVLLQMFKANDNSMELVSSSSLVDGGHSVRTATTLKIGNKEYSCSRKDISDLRRQ